MSALFHILNIAATIIGWLILVVLVVGFCITTVIVVWDWLTEQIWEAGYRVRRRWAKKAKEPPHA